MAFPVIWLLIMIVPETFVSYWSISKKNSHWFTRWLDKNYAKEVKGKDYGTNLKNLVYLRKKINPKVKFTFYKLDKVETKILKKYKII